MAFKTFSVSPNAQGAWDLCTAAPFVLSGKNGLLARFVRADTARAMEPWSLTLDALLVLAGHPEDAAASVWILLEQIDDGDLRLSKLEKITGVSGHQTEVLLTLSPLNVTRQDGELSVIAPPNARAWIEELAVDGGALNLEGTWRWCDRSLNIGAMVVGGKGR